MAETVRVLHLEEFPRGLEPCAVADMVGTALEQRAPLVVRGGCHRACAKWTDAWLVALFDGRECNVSLDSRPAQVENSRQLSLERYLDEGRSADARTDAVEYLFHTVKDPVGAGDRLDDLDLLPSFFTGTVPTLFRFFAGPPGAGSLPHFHPRSCAINALVRGRKRWAIYEELDMSEMTVMLRRWDVGNHVRDWFFEACPALRTRDLRLWEFVQEAGDVVVVPPRYTHAVLNLSAATGFTIEVAGA